MNTREYSELFRYLMEKVCLPHEDIVFVENIARWCREQGIPETDKERPLKLVLDEKAGCRMLIRENIPDKIVTQRIDAMRIRGQVQNVAFDRAEMLDSDYRKLAYLFLSEYAFSLPEISGDPLLADNWAFDEMERLGYFKEQKG